MPEPPFALTSIETARLEALLRHAHRGELACPITPIALVALGFQDSAEVILGTLRGLELAGVRAVLVAVLAERRLA